MTRASFHYHAFISYRHASPDREWAAWLHSAIESYRVPGKLAEDKGLPERVRPLFRDQEELPASSDLTDSIVKALRESKTLVVVCSPSTPRSRWVNEEVRRFRQLRPGGRVLALLVAGEPSQSFPPALLEPGDGTPGEQGEGKVEPLAADVRPSAGASSRKIKRTAKLKLIAAILDCGYDELLRREAQRRRRNYAVYAAVLTVVVALTGVLTFRWSRERRTALSLGLAAAALGHLDADPDLAALLSLKAVGVEPTWQAEDALRQSALRLSDRLAVLKGHAGGVYHAAFSPDGLSVLTAGEDGVARIWKPVTGRSRTTLRGHAGPVVYAELSRDGGRVVTASMDGTARVWEAATGKPVAELRGHTGSVLRARFSPDGERVVTAGQDCTARLWDAGAGDSLAVLRGHAGPLSNAVFSPDGRRVATASLDQTARVWDVSTGRSLFVLQHHTGQDTHLKPDETNAVFSVAFSPDGGVVLTGSADGRARIWEAGTGKRLAELAGRDILAREAAFSPDGKLVVATSNNTARVWDAATGNRLADLNGHTGLINAAAFSPGGKLVVTASYDGTARVWDAATGGALAVLRGHRSWVVAAAFSPDERFIVTASADATARVWLPSGRRADTLRGHTDYVRAAAFSPDSRFIATAGYDRTARVWEIGAAQEPLVLRGHAGRIAGVAYAPDGKLIVTASEDGTARIFDAGTGETRSELRGHAGRVNGALFSPDGRVVLTYGDDGAARLWDVASGRVTSELSHPAGVTRAAYSRDGRRLLTTCFDGKARVWDTGAGRVVAERATGLQLVDATAFSPDGERVVTVGADERGRAARLSVWEAGTGRDVVELRGDATSIEGVSYAGFSPEGKFVLTAQGSVARVADAATGETLFELRGHERRIHGAAFSPDGRYVVTTSMDDTARLWDARSGKALVVLPSSPVPPDLLPYSSTFNLFAFAAFSPDGRYVVTSNVDREPSVYLCEVCGPLADVRGLVRARVARDLTPEERRTYLHE